MKIYNSEQIRELDRVTILNEPVSSIDLMERAAMSCVLRIIKLCEPNEKIIILCGKGNNGGDGLAITRLLRDRSFQASALIIQSEQNFTADCKTNFDKLKDKYREHVSEVHSFQELETINLQQQDLIIDAMLGSGLNRPVNGLLSDAIEKINNSEKRVISVDIPSGLFSDKDSSANSSIIRCNLCLTFQFPKLSFLLPLSQQFVPEFELLDIGLKESLMENTNVLHHYITTGDICNLLKPRKKFSHKGSFGHALLLAGSKGKSGAAIIAAKSALRSGAGLLTVHSNRETLRSLLLHLPEAMTLQDENPDKISTLEKTESYNAIGFGPGTGTDEETQQVLKKLLHYYAGKLVIDADGLNILSENKTWLSFLPPGTILTPHIKEFERLTEKTENDWDRLSLLKQFVLKYNCIVILKGAHSVIAMPDGNLFFNSSGNAGLAKGGSGDALTGIILGLMARGYNSPQSALIGVFVHGLAADLCVNEMSQESLLISDVVSSLPKAFRILEKNDRTFK